MDWYATLLELIDMRSFSNLWYWIALAVMWSSASHWILGVPFDLVHRALRQGGQSAQDLVDLTRVNINRLLHTWEVAGLWLLGGLCFVLSALAILGFVYDLEFAQAVFLLAAPMSLVGALQLRTARRIRDEVQDVPDLAGRLGRCRVAIQGIGAVAIFVTALWGMYQNLAIGVL